MLQTISDDAALLEGIRRGDEHAFDQLLQCHGAAMLRLARMYTRDSALAEDAVQDAWLGFLKGLDHFESRASLRTWLFRILLNRLKTRLEREGRMIPFSHAFAPGEADAEAAVDGARFLDAGHPRYPGHWKLPPQAWGASPEQQLMAHETRAMIDRAIEVLPDAQREVLTLRDIEGFSAKEVCELLQISEANQRVLLHRARSRIRNALEEYFAQG